LIGKTLDHYEILEQIGAGGMGEVYRARDTRLDRIVAVKVLPPQFSQDSERRQRFDREAKTISSLQHPNICTLHDLGSHDGVDYLVMEFIDGETLSDRLKLGPLPPADVLHYGAQIAQALDRAHRSNIVHRDLKPGNVMLTKAGVKLLDFGLAKMGETANSAGVAVTQAVTERNPIGTPGSASGPLTAEGTILGTFQYMAPEQLEGAEADRRSDIFALGSVLYEMATGRKAFEGKSQASLIAAILEREPTPLTSITPMTPPALDHIIRKCLAKDPDDRWQSASDVAGQLQWIGESSSQAGVPAVVSSRRRVKSRLAWAVAAVAGAAALALAALLVLDRPEPPRVARFEVSVPEGVTFVRSVALSPDGTRMAIGSRGTEGDQIWLRPLDDLFARPLPGTEGADFPVWSPDGTQIAFFARGKLRRVPVAGGPSQAVCDAPQGDAGSWSQNDVILFDGSFNDAIARVSAGGGNPEAAVGLDSTQVGNTYGWPEFLPDGRHYLFVEILTGEFQLFWGDIETGKMGVIGPIESRVQYVEPGYLLHVTDETLVAQPFDADRREFTGPPVPLAEDLRVNNWGDATFSASGNGMLAYRSLGEDREHFIWTDRNGRVSDEFGDAASSDNVALGPDGRIVADRSGGSALGFDLWVIDPKRGTTSRLTFGNGTSFAPVWSRDGRDVYYTTQIQADRYEVRRRAASGVGEPETLYKNATMCLPRDTSPGDRELVMMIIQPSTSSVDLFVLDLTTPGAEPQVFLASPFNEDQAKLSPDGRWIVYRSDESGRPEIYIRSFPDGDSKWQISAEGGEQPIWRADGGELFFISADRRLMAVPIDGGAALQAGTPQELFTISWSSAGRYEYDASPDGQTFLFLRDVIEADPSPIVLVMNWMEELAK
jgi:Tol biopolymer transport system component